MRRGTVIRREAAECFVEHEEQAGALQHRQRSEEIKESKVGESIVLTCARVCEPQRWLLVSCP